ncbi:unnamed protein product [Brassica napus]|uniref:RNA-dependent RNA polymerase n=1 Tax=Brassica napus TaxID=3708 RepID=A0A816SAP2_BRANA|nr:unnamed protein product [Brassica napus]
MGKTVNVSGFPPEVNAMEFAQETHANKLLTQSTEVNTPYRLNFHEWKYEIDSKDKASMEHYIDGLLMHFGFLATPEKFKYLYNAGCSFGSGGPKIYENQNQHVDPEYEKLNFCRGGFDNEWIRTTDFTSTSLIGQSSAIVFKFPRELKNGCLPPTSLDTAFYQFLDPKTLDRAFIDYALPKLLSLGKCPYDHIAWLTKEYLEWGKKEKPTESTLDYQHGLFDIRRVKITPTRVYFSGPKPHESNRVLREYAKHINNFIIVSFVDENLKTLSCNDLSPTSSINRKTKVYDRIYSVLSDGVVIGKKKIDFLAYSASQLKSTSTWMFAPIEGVKAADIRSWMGDFGSIKNVAKYAARLGNAILKECLHLCFRLDMEGTKE